MKVHRLLNTERLPALFQIEMRDLAEGMHARVGPARTDDADLAAGERAQRLDDLALHGGRARLDLPAPYDVICVRR